MNHPKSEIERRLADLASHLAGLREARSAISPDALEFEDGFRRPIEFGTEYVHFYTNYRILIQTDDLSDIKGKLLTAYDNGSLERYSAAVEYLLTMLDERLKRLQDPSMFNLVSLGEDCLPRSVPTKWGLKLPRLLGEPTMPFDLAVHPPETVAHILETDFIDYQEPENLWYDAERKHCVDKKWNVLWNHEMGSDWEANGFARLRARYVNRIANFRAALNDGHPTVLFLYISSALDDRAIRTAYRITRAINRIGGNRTGVACLCSSERSAFDSKARPCHIEWVGSTPLMFFALPRPHPWYIWWSHQHFTLPEGLIFETGLIDCILRTAEKVCPGTLQTSRHRSFVVCSAEDIGSPLVDLDNGGPYKRSRPVIRGPVALWISRLLEREIDKQAFPPAAKVVKFHNATVRGPGVITLSDDKIIRESLINCGNLGKIGDLTRSNDSATYKDLTFSEATFMPDHRYVLLKQMWDSNYGHWVVEGLPRVALLYSAVDVTKCLFLVSHQEPAMHRVFLDSLSAFGIYQDQIMVSGWEPRIYKELIYPLPLTVQPWIKAPLVVRTLEDLGKRIASKRMGPPGAEKLFVLRPETSRRALRNQGEIADFFRHQGYLCVTPGVMSFEEQVVAFSNAVRVAGTLGAECTNIAFSKTGVRFLGFAPEHMQDDFFYDLVFHKSGLYFSLHGASENPEAGMNSPFSVDMIALTSIFSEFDTS